MQIIPGSKEFVFLNTRQALTPSLNQVLAYTLQCLPAIDRTGDVYFRIKMVVAELLTNAYKHAGTETIKLLMEIDNRHISIKKNDHGRPFLLNGQVQPHGERICLAADIMHVLYAVTHPDNLVHFFVEDREDEHPDINKVTEHFGLLIITKCADDFIYQYDKASGQNSFIVKIKLGEKVNS